jgi:hypothetical protein
MLKRLAGYIEDYVQILKMAAELTLSNIVHVNRVETRGNYMYHLAVPWLRSLVAGLSPRRPGFAPGSIHVGFVVDKVGLGQVFLRVLLFFPVSIIPPSLSKLISSGECVIR